MPRCPLLLLLTVALTGCPSTPDSEPVDIPPSVEVGGLQADVHYHAGSVLEPGDEAVPHAHPHVAWAVRVSVVALDRIDPKVGQPLSTLTRLVTTVTGPRPFLVAPELLAGARGQWLPSAAELRGWLEDGRAGRAERVAMLRGVLVHGATAVFELDWPERRERLAVWLHRREEEERTLLDVGISKSSGPGVTRERRVQELLLLDPRAMPDDSEGLVAVLPCAGNPAAVAVLLEVAPPPTSGSELVEHELACERFRTRPPEASEPEHHDPARTDEDVEGLLTDATRKGVSVAEQRHALARLSRARGARLCYELALAGSDALVVDLARRLAGAASDDGWSLERAALDAVQGALPLGGEDDRGLRTLLVVYAGAAGYRPNELFACASEADDLASLEAKLVLANRALLEDPAPAVSERARSWLRAAGHAE